MLQLLLGVSSNRQKKVCPLLIEVLVTRTTSDIRRQMRQHLTEPIAAYSKKRLTFSTMFYQVDIGQRTDG